MTTTVQHSPLSPLLGTSGGTGLSVVPQHSVIVGNSSTAYTGIVVGTNGQVLIGSTSGNPAFGTIASSAGSIVPTGGAGTLNLDVTGWVAAGTWTPAFSLATAGTSAWTYSSQFGRYCQIGAVVYFTAQLVWSGFSVGTGSGNWQVSLPVTAGAFTVPGLCTFNGTGWTANAADTNFLVTIGSGAAIGLIAYERNTAGTVSTGTYAAAAVANTGTMNITGFYFQA